jgi:16S rRNA processing protein RimM
LLPGRTVTALDDPVVWPEDAVEVGRIVDAWGIKGGFKVHPFSSNPQALFSSRRWFLQPAEARSPRTAALPALLRITEAREQGDVVVASAQEVPDRTAAEQLKGARVFVSRASFPTAEKDEYYWVDLIGLTVVNRNGTALGTVADLMDTGAHSVLRVSYEGVGAKGEATQGERLIPFVSAYVDSVDIPARRIVVDWDTDYE